MSLSSFYLAGYFASRELSHLLNLTHIMSGVEIDLHSLILNFFNKSLAYLALCRKILPLLYWTSILRKLVISPRFVISKANIIWALKPFKYSLSRPVINRLSTYKATINLIESSTFFTYKVDSIKLLLNPKPLKYWSTLSYQTHGACLRPYKAFTSLKL